MVNKQINNEVSEISNSDGNKNTRQLTSITQPLIAVLLYTLVAIAFTWPLVLNLSNHSAGTQPYDREQNIWYLWWARQSLTNFHVNPYFTDYLFFPNGINLYLFPASLTTAIISLPFQALFDLQATFNIMYFMGVVGGAWGAYFLARYLTGSFTGALFAGLVYAFSPWHNYASDFNQLNILQLQWLPFFLYFLVRYLDLFELEDKLEARPLKIRCGVLAALFLVLLAFSDQYHLLFASILSTYLVLWRTFKHWRKDGIKEAGKVLLRAGVIVIPALVAFSPVLLGIARDSLSGFYDRTQNLYSVGVNFPSLLYPSALGAKYGGILPDALGINYSRSDISLGYVALILGVIGIIKAPKARIWGILFVLSALFSLGNPLKINEAYTDIPFLSGILGIIPVLNTMREVWRWLIPGSLTLGVCAAFGIIALFGKADKTTVQPFRWRQGLVFGLATLLFIIEVNPQPVDWNGWQDIEIPQVFQKNLLTNPGALLELPLDENSLDKADNMLYQTEHGRPIPGGYLPRPPFTNYAASPFAYFFEVHFPDKTDIVEQTENQLRSFLTYNHFAYVVLYKRDLPDERLQKFRQMINRIGSTKCLSDDEETLACAIEPPTTVQTFMAITEGWYGVEKDDKNGTQRWLRGQTGTIGAFVPTSGTYQFSFEGAAYLKPRELVVKVDGKEVARQMVDTTRKAYSLNLPVSAGNHLITLFCPESADRPSNNGVPADTRALTILFSKVTLTSASPG